MKKFVVAAALAATTLAAAPASAASFIVTLGGAPVAVPAVNDFKGDLASLGFTLESVGALINVSGPGRIRFEFLGSESGYRDTFSFPGLPSFTETSLIENHFDDSVELGWATAGSGPLQVQFTTSGNPIQGARPASIGTPGFAVFLPTGTTQGYETNVVYFGYDDRGQFDDNHDDFIVRATITAVPEPATWAMMIGGLGLVGATMRRGRGMKIVTA